MSAKNILHFATDEKFINAANYLYEKAFPGKNTFIIIKPAADPPLKYVNIQDNFEVYVRSRQLADTLFNKAKKYRVIIFHGLNKEMVMIFNRSQNKHKYIWTFWGAEVYNSKHTERSLYGPKTRLIEMKISEDTIGDKLKQIYRRIRYRNINRDSKIDKKKAIRNFYFIARLNEDISHLKKAGIINKECKTIPFSYYPLEFIFDNLDRRVCGKNILLGNSSSTTNNHVEIIDELVHLDFEDRKVITPLSYGSKKYADIIEKYGREKLGNSFYPLREFLPLDEYHRLICSCSIVIMNHYRPQGVGTVLASLYLGSKIFLNDTPFYSYLKKEGFYIFSIQDDLISRKEKVLESLNTAEVQHNRKRLKEEISTETLINKLRESFKENFNI